MLAERPIDASEIRALARETDQAARRLLTRASHLERLAARSWNDPTGRADFSSRAKEMRTAAEQLLLEVCELSRHARMAKRRFP